MNSWSLKLQVDVPEPRLLTDRLVASADGTTWDMTVSTDVYVDPVTRTAMLNPLPRTPDWATTFTGDFARLAITDYTLITSSAWVQHELRGTGDFFLESQGVSEIVTTTASYPRNRAMYLSCYVYGGGSAALQFLECGWGDPSTGVKLVFFPGGVVWVYKGGVKVGVYDLQGTDLMTGGIRQGRTGQLVGNFADFLLIPCRGRELLVLSSAGPGFVHVFQDLTDDGTVKTITPVGSFWWYVPSQYKACVQLAPLKFKTSGAIYGQPVTYRYAPLTGTTLTGIAASNGTGAGTQSAATGLVDATTLATFTPDGSSIGPVRAEIAFTGDGNSTTFAYATDLIYDSSTTTTYDGAVDVTPYLTELKLTVPEKGPAKLVFGLKRTRFDLTDGVPDPTKTRINLVDEVDRPEIIFDRPIRLYLTNGTTNIDIFRGTTDAPATTYSVTSLADHLAFEATDREHMMDLYSFRDTLPYDGLQMTAVQKSIVELPGIDPSSLSFSTDSFVLPYSTGVSLGDWQLLPQRGDTAAKWFNQIHRDYAATWIRGWRPTATGYKFQFAKPGDLPTSAAPTMTIYKSRVGAAAGSVARNLQQYRTVRSFVRTPHAAEANQILIVGYDPRTRRYITGQYDDAASQDPTTAPASRPANWRGQLVTYQLIDPNISKQSAADRAVSILTDRLTVNRELWEIGADFLIRNDTGNVGVPVWKGDVIRVKEDDATTVTCAIRVLAFEMEAVYESGGSSGTRVSVRNATYHGVNLIGTTGI